MAQDIAGEARIEAVASTDVQLILRLRLLIVRAANRDSLAWWDDEALTAPAGFLLERLFPVAPSWPPAAWRCVRRWRGARAPAPGLEAHCICTGWMPTTRTAWPCVMCRCCRYRIQRRRSQPWTRCGVHPTLRRAGRAGRLAGDDHAAVVHVLVFLRAAARAIRYRGHGLRGSTRVRRDQREKVEKVNTTVFTLRAEANPERRENAVGAYFRLVNAPAGGGKRFAFEQALAALRKGGAR